MVNAQEIAAIRQTVSAAVADLPRPDSIAPQPALDADTPLARYIDHTLLKPEATAHEIEVLCAEAREYGFASVCVNGVFVPLAAHLLHGSAVKVCTVVGFPLGASQPQVKAYEAELAIQQGAQEIDMVLHVGAVKSADYPALFADIATVVTACHREGVLCKVILETSKLTDTEKVIACVTAQLAGADFVKTSTGFGGGGATVDDITLMRQTVGPEMGVKASGGVRNYADAKAIVEAGATRIGASAGVAIVKGQQGQGDY